MKKKILTACAFVCVCAAAAGPAFAGEGDNGLSAEMNAKIDSLMEVMTLQEKIGQMVLFTTRRGATGVSGKDGYVQDIRSGRCGNVFNAYSAAHVRRLQRDAVEKSRLGIPLLFGYDIIHGCKTIFPIPLGESCSWDMEMIRRSAAVAAAEAAAGGLNWTYAPMVDISVEPRWGRVAEGAGEDPYLGSRIAAARVRGFQGDDLADTSTVMACVKHFAGYGAPQAGREYNTVDMSERWLREFYLPTYKAGVEAGAMSVMTSFNELDGVPATCNRHLLQDILAGEWGFDGIVVTDYSGMNETVNHGYAADGKDAADKAANAGVDMDMQGQLYYDCLEDLVNEGKVGMDVIDRSARRVLEAKAQLGLFDDPYRYCDPEREEAVTYSEGNLEAALDAARESMVLLKNDGALPLKEGEKIAVIGELAMAKRDLLGSWKAVGDWDFIPSVAEALSERGGADNVAYAAGCGVMGEDRSGFPEAMAAAERADKVVMVIGESCEWCGEAASRADIRIPGVQTELLEMIAATGKPVAVVLMNGRPLDLSRESSLADAILEAWYPGTMGAKAVAETLYGDSNPSGKLTMTFPRTIGQVPIYYYAKNTGRPSYLDTPKYKSTYLDCPADPLYPFGYGLSYTHFTYSDLTLSADGFSEGGSLVVSARVTNDGPVAGTEVAQFYIRDLVGSVTRPVRQLKGFERVRLEPGESATVSFTVDEETISFYRQDMSYGPEPGDFHAFVGGSSADCDLLRASFSYR